ncbi:MAG: tRNA cyclic N6-threonylcarbamoyladenosine(37) synthase TcdA [Chromatiaceae bacterium]|nr:tRNA cyclic N6-threonylcarbamoyladenosine(37) synthase TcdA [Gammaproteobacteria bacterium]MCB1871470.1 tRNA cyclic N6-threonylcarbamoyladenosine(37) synthase TcdA [Gammaproteobacteria bacterium]MCP5448463.1 tRNA cyclic N6-threonylcarbamoyladenosine(37) synthase TcdA [Chromatiaceae bacterium]
MAEDQTPDYARRFGGIARVYGAAALQRFTGAHVCVIGIGGVGSWAAEALARSAIGELTLIDLDNVAESNVNRQIHALDGEFGRPKVAAMAERIRAINPRCRLHCEEEFIEPGNLDRLIDGRLDHVVDCIDAYRTKAALIAHCRRGKIPVVTVGGAGGQIDPLKITLADLSRSEQDPLLSQTRRVLRKEYGFSRNLQRRFSVPCVFSREQQRQPESGRDGCRVENGVVGMTGLNCAGFGSSVAVTASFGLVAVAHVLSKIAESAGG